MKKYSTVALIIILFVSNTVNAYENLHPDYAEFYLGKDKFENFNRKMYKFNSGLNKFAVKPLHKVWASVMPKYGMDRIAGVAENAEYPRKLISNLIQRDFKSGRVETLRFLTNTTIGLGGMFDAADYFFDLKPSNEDMDQALAKCKVNSGPYCVLPVLSSLTPRSAVAKGLDTALNPTSYIATPVLALIKFGLVLNKTSYAQPLISLVESNYADPYEISKKFYALDRDIKNKNLDKNEILHTDIKRIEKPSNEEIKEISSNIDENLVEQDIALKETIKEISTDITLSDYNPQDSITDSMRTALFSIPDLDKSIWSELSIWNRSFINKIKTSSIELAPERDKYKFKYILNKNKNSPLAIIIPSIGEGVNSHHSVCFAKIFFDEGYSVLIMGNPFQWEFVKSCDKNYRPGIPQNDADYMKFAIAKIKQQLENKYERKFENNVLLGTSLGAMNGLFIADKEANNNTLSISKYIAICPPIELLYAMQQVDKNNIYDGKPSYKEDVSSTAAKILKLLETKEKLVSENKNSLPFTENEAKIITNFIMHQKLSDLVYTIENEQALSTKDLYKEINNMNYQDYVKKYLLSENSKTIEDIESTANLYNISDFLKTSNNYKIFHSNNDYLTSPEQILKLKESTSDKMIIFDNGAHLGFLYRKEFLDLLKKDIKLEVINQ